MTGTSGCSRQCRTGSLGQRRAGRDLEVRYQVRIARLLRPSSVRGALPAIFLEDIGRSVSSSTFTAHRLRRPLRCSDSSAALREGAEGSAAALTIDRSCRLTCPVRAYLFVACIFARFHRLPHSPRRSLARSSHRTRIESRSIETRLPGCRFWLSAYTERPSS